MRRLPVKIVFTRKKRIICMLSKKKCKNKNSKLSKDGPLSYYFYFFAFVANDASLPS